MIYPPTESKQEFALGWLNPELDCFWEKKEQHWVYFNNLANIAGYKISPIIGLIRFVTNAYFLIKDRDLHGHEWHENEKSYLKAQMFRALIELNDYGYLLCIPDIIWTINRYKRNVTSLENSSRI